MMAEEADLPGKKDYARELVYKHSWRGERDRRIARIKRLGRKRYMKWGLALGLALGIALAVLFIVVIGAIP